MPAVTATSLRPLPAGLDWLEEDAATTFPVLRQQGPNGTINYWPELFAATTARAMLPDLGAIAESWRPDVVLREPLEFAGALLAETLGLPHATVGPGLFATPALRQRFLGPYLAAMREVAGLPPDPALRMLFRYLDLACLPPAFLAGQQHLIEPVTHFVRPLPVSSASSSPLPAWLAGPLTPPVVYVTLGTVFNRTPGVFATILAGLRAEPYTVIVTTGETVEPGTVGAPAPNIHVERFLPLGALLPKCDVVVTHGGYNTVMACLAAGCPMVLVPLGADQFDNARRCIAVGAGLGITRDNLTAEHVRRVVQEVLANEAYRHEARRMAGEIARLPGARHAVELVERLARERAPLLARP